MSVPSLPVEPNARRLNRAVGPVFLSGILCVAALVTLLTLLLAYAFRMHSEAAELRQIDGEASSLVAKALYVQAYPTQQAKDSLKAATAAWSAKVTQRSAQLQETVDRQSIAGRDVALFAQSQMQLRSNLGLVAAGTGKGREGVAKALDANLADLKKAIRGLTDRSLDIDPPLGVVVLGGVVLLALLVQYTVTMKGTRWRLAVVVRDEMRDVLEENRLQHDKDRVLVEEKATQVLRAKQADLEAQAEALRIALTKAEESSLVKSAFLGNVSHEIRTPLNGILATSEVLAQTPLDDEQVELVHTVVASADQLTKIISDILDLAQMEAGRFQLEVQPFDLRELVREVVQPYQALAMAKSVQFEVTLPPDQTCTVASDPVRVKQILANIVSNAAKFTHKGRIDLGVETLQTGDGMVELRFNISDTGIGIDPSRLPTIFEHFNQGDNSSKRTYGGTGLGLTIAKQLVEVLGGQIGVNSERGVGSHFWVALPVQASSREAIPSEHAPIVTEIPHLGMKVLVVEDNLVNQKMMQKLLIRCACSVDLAENGAEAVERALFGHYDVILMDIHMPVMDGVEATVEIRRKEREWNRRRTPIIAVTADVMEERRRKFMEAGMDGFVPKPVRLATLLPVLEERSHELNRKQHASASA